jgi:hypothetical protein
MLFILSLRLFVRWHGHFGVFDTMFLLMCVGFELKTDLHEIDLCCLMHSTFMRTNRTYVRLSVT